MAHLKFEIVLHKSARETIFGSRPPKCDSETFAAPTVSMATPRDFSLNVMASWTCLDGPTSDSANLRSPNQPFSFGSPSLYNCSTSLPERRTPPARGGLLVGMLVFALL